MVHGKERLCLVLVAAIVVGGSFARADALDMGNEVSVRILRYRPAIDSEFSDGSSPYALMFDSGGMWGGRLEYAKTVFGAAGTLGLGLGIGYMGAQGHGLYQDSKTGDWTSSGDSTALHVIPVSLFAMYRLDALASRYGVPLAPYVRASLERYLWMTTGTEHPSRTGATNGHATTLGFALLLDRLDPSRARELSRETGIRHTCVTFEATRAVVNDFGSPRSWDLSTVGWSLSGGVTVTF